MRGPRAVAGHVARPICSVLLVAAIAMAYPLVGRAAIAQEASGLSGRVTDAGDGAPLRGASVEVSGASSATTLTDAAGRYDLNLPPGTYTVTVRRIGYRPATRTAVVSGSRTTELVIALEASTNSLERVVVTGTVAATEMKAVPNTMSVLTASDIQSRGAQSIEELLRTDVPGVFGQELGYGSNGVTRLYVRGVATLGSGSFPLNYTPLKTYIDGIEMADPNYLSTIDVRSIERIEIIPGPQASTLYGSGAVTGVMQIFTKRGLGHRDRPTIFAQLSSGTVQSTYSKAVTAQHDYLVRAEGGDQTFSYNGGATYQETEPWLPRFRNRIRGASVGLRRTEGRLTADISARLSWRDFASGSANDYDEGVRSGLSRISVASTVPAKRTVDQQTLGLALSYDATSWWHHRLVIGQDRNTYALTNLAPGYSSPSDSLVSYSNSASARTSISYNTTLSTPLGAFAHSTLTVGADRWHFDNINAGSGFTASLTGNTVGGTPTLSRSDDDNKGAFAQWQVGVAEQLFFTFGFRAERNSNYGADYGTNFAPRYGVSYARTLRGLTAKVRGAYGRATRAPTAGQRDGLRSTAAADFLTPYYSRLPAAHLRPEHQRGGEIGLDLQIGQQGLVSVTRYDQRVDDLITQVSGVDSVASVLRPGTYLNQSQYRNVSQVTNQGWEARASYGFNSLRASATYSYVNSRITKANNGLGTGFGRVGYRFSGVPAHTGALTLAYEPRGATIRLDMNFVGSALSQYFGQSELSRLRFQQDEPRILTYGSGYFVQVGRYATADLNATRTITSHITAIARVRNLTNTTRNDYQYGEAVIGRTSLIGAQVRW